MLGILVPSRGRPHNLTRLHAAVEATCTGAYTLYVRLDDDDPAVYPRIPGVDYTTGPRVFFAASANELAGRAAADGATHLAVFGDDVLPETHGWDTKLITALNSQIGVAYGSDGLEHKHGPDLPTHVIVPTEMYTRLGWVVLPTLRHLFADNVWRELGRATRFEYLPGVKLSHLHRWNKRAPDDRTYQEANDKRKRIQDRIAFETWRDGPGFTAAVAALS